MARGMVVGEAVVSQANNDAYREGYAKALGDGKPQHGRWVWDPDAKCLVDAASYVPPARAVDAPIISGRIHEGVVAPDGTDIGSRAKRKAWMAATGTVDYDDFKGVRAKVRAEKAARARGEFKPDKELRDVIGRELYKQKVIL